MVATERENGEVGVKDAYSQKVGLVEEKEP